MICPISSVCLFNINQANYSKSTIRTKFEICSQLTTKKLERHHRYGIRLSHIFEIVSISNKKPSISTKIPSISIKNFGFRSKY